MLHIEDAAKKPFTLPRDIIARSLGKMSRRLTDGFKYLKAFLHCHGK